MNPMAGPRDLRNGTKRGLPDIDERLDTILGRLPALACQKD